MNPLTAALNMNMIHALDTGHYQPTEISPEIYQFNDIFASSPYTAALVLTRYAKSLLEQAEQGVLDPAAEYRIHFININRKVALELNTQEGVATAQCFTTNSAGEHKPYGYKSHVEPYAEALAGLECMSKVLDRLTETLKKEPA